jgi:hypothetical protein
MKHVMLLMGLLALGPGVYSSRAVDPLPPELENAPLKKQEEYWQRTSKESAVQRAKVAEQRYQAAVAYKQVLQAQMEDRLVAYQANAQATSDGSGSTMRPDEEPTSWGLYGLMAMIVCGGVVFMNHQLRQSEQLA